MRSFPSSEKVQRFEGFAVTTGPEMLERCTSDPIARRLTGVVNASKKFVALLEF